MRKCRRTAAVLLGEERRASITRDEVASRDRARMAPTPRELILQWKEQDQLEAMGETQIDLRIDNDLLVR